MLEQLKEFAKANGLEFSYTIDKAFDAHRFIFTNPKTEGRWSYMIHGDRLKVRKDNDKQGFIDFLIDNARKLI